MATAIKEKLVGFKIDEQLEKDLDKYLQENDTDKSKVFRTALRQFLNQSSPVQKTGKKAS